MGLIGILPVREWIDSPRWSRRLLKTMGGMFRGTSPTRRFGLGMANGFLPCGPVYTVALTATASGKIASGASGMLAYGLGTLPVLIALGLGTPGDIAGATRDWCASLGLTMSLAAYGASEADLHPWAEEAHAIRRLMDNNPREMSVDDVEAIYRAAF